MKDYSYFIPGYTGFCPDLREHFGQTYGHATRHIIQEKPHLEDRLAPVFYNYRRSEQARRTYGKYCDHEKEKGDRPKLQRRVVLDPCKVKRGVKHEDGDANKGKYRAEYMSGEPCRGKYHAECMRGDVGREKYRTDYADGDRIRNEDYKRTCPKLIYVKGYAEYIHPETLTAQGKQNWHPEKCPFVVMPCVHPKEVSSQRKDPYAPMPCMHLKEISSQRKNLYAPMTCRHLKEVYYQKKEPYTRMPCVHTKGYPEVSRQKKDPYQDPRIWRVPRITPHRQGGVIPKYTGHIPGMLFSFGESYGPASDRLLRRHHDSMKRHQRNL